MPAVNRSEKKPPTLCGRWAGCTFYNRKTSDRLTCDGYNTNCAAYTEDRPDEATLSQCRAREGCAHYNGDGFGKCDGNNRGCRSWVTFYDVVPCNLGKCPHKCGECAAFKEWAEAHRERREAIIRLC